MVTRAEARRILEAMIPTKTVSVEEYIDASIKGAKKNIEMASEFSAKGDHKLATYFLQHAIGDLEEARDLTADRKSEQR